MELKREISGILNQLGVPAHVKGYQYIREAVLVAVEDEEAIGGITKILYPTVAKRFRATSAQVERNIRHAIQMTWRQGDPDILKRILGDRVPDTGRRPTNGAFIAAVKASLDCERAVSC